MNNKIEIGQYRIYISTHRTTVYQVVKEVGPARYKIRPEGSELFTPTWPERWIIRDRVLTEIERLLYE